MELFRTKFNNYKKEIYNDITNEKIEKLQCELQEYKSLNESLQIQFYELQDEYNLQKGLIMELEDLLKEKTEGEKCFEPRIDILQDVIHILKDTIKKHQQNENENKYNIKELKNDIEYFILKLKIFWKYRTN